MSRPPATPPLFDDATMATLKGRKPRRAPTLTPHLPFKGLRRNGFADRTPERNADDIREIFIDRLDRLFADWVGPLVVRYGLEDRDVALRLLQDVQVALFPEAFLEPEDKPHAGLIPAGGRVVSGTREGLALLADAIRAARAADAAKAESRLRRLAAEEEAGRAKAAPHAGRSRFLAE